MTGNADKDGEQQEIGEEGGETDREGEKEQGGGGGILLLLSLCTVGRFAKPFPAPPDNQTLTGKKGLGVWTPVKPVPVHAD